LNITATEDISKNKQQNAMRAFTTTLLLAVVSESLARVSATATTNKTPLKMHIQERTLGTTLFAMSSDGEEVDLEMQKFLISNGIQTLSADMTNLKEASHDNGQITINNGTHTLEGSLDNAAMRFLETAKLLNGTHFVDTTYWNFEDDDKDVTLNKRNAVGGYDQECSSKHLSRTCKWLHRDACINSMEMFDDNTMYNPGGKGSGTCNDGCGTFIKGKNCRLTGRELKGIFRSMMEQMPWCEKCMWRKYNYGDECEIKADRVSYCGGGPDVKYWLGLP
jgi:hypothetical protein